MATQNDNRAYLVPLAIFFSGLLVAGAVLVADEINPIAEKEGTAVVAEGGAAPEEGTPTPESRYPSEPLRDRIAIDYQEGLLAKGDENAPVTIYEISEFACPFCAEYAGADVIPSRDIDQDQSYATIMKEYVDQGLVRYVFVDLILHGPIAAKAHEVFHCAAEQGKGWEMHDAIFTGFSDWTQASETEAEPKLVGYAAEVGLNPTTIQACLDEGRYSERVAENTSFGRQLAETAAQNGFQEFIGRTQDGEEYASTGTPTFFINGRPLIGAQPYSSFEALIEEELGR